MCLIDIQFEKIPNLLNTKNENRCCEGKNLGHAIVLWVSIEVTTIHIVGKQDLSITFQLLYI